MRDNRLKRLVRERRVAIGAWLWLDSPTAAEIVSRAGFDFVMIDHEHGSGNMLSAISLMRAVQAGGEATIAMRLASNDTNLIKRALDAGAEALMIPAVDTAADAKRAVEASRYPPAGRRGAAYPFIRASDYGVSAATYPDHAAKEIMVICQIESVTAVDNIAAIAAVEGVDAMFLGPLDMSGTAGMFGKLGEPAMRALIARAEEAIKSTGKAMGGVPLGGETPKSLLSRGYDLVLVGSDLVFVRDGAANLVKDCRP